MRLALKTSFSGKDLLYTRLRAGNMDNAFSYRPFVYWPGSLNVYFDTDNVLLIDRFYYRFPLGDSFTVQVGPTTRNTEMMGYKASAYAKGGSKILDFFGGSLGTPGVWNKETGGGFGAIYSLSLIHI